MRWDITSCTGPGLELQKLSKWLANNNFCIINIFKDSTDSDSIYVCLNISSHCMDGHYLHRAPLPLNAWPLKAGYAKGL